MRRYYINKINDIHKKQEDAAKGQNSDQQAMESFENLNIDWNNPPDSSNLKHEL